MLVRNRRGQVIESFPQHSHSPNSISNPRLSFPNRLRTLQQGTATEDKAFLKMAPPLGNVQGRCWFSFGQGCTHSCWLAYGSHLSCPVSVWTKLRTQRPGTTIPHVAGICTPSGSQSPDSLGNHSLGETSCCHTPYR